MEHLEEHIVRKKENYERYRDGFKDLPVKMNPFDAVNSIPNFWLSCMTVNPEAMCSQVRGEREVVYIKETGKTCPTEILESLSAFGVEGRPIWKPMHMQPIYGMKGFVTREGDKRTKADAYRSKERVGEDGERTDIGREIFHRGLCLPSDIKMTEKQQGIVIDIIHRCFQ